MKAQRVNFTISLADVPVCISCRYQENKAFLQDYLTDRRPLFTVSPTDQDIRRMQEDFDRMDEADGIPKQQRTERLLENNAIHALLAEKLVEYGVLLMHGSALCMDGQGIIFTGKSGTGKSTHARLWREAFGSRVWMINDDKPLIRLADGKAVVYGSPWDGKHHLSRNACAPLKAIVSLHRDRNNRIEPMGREEAFLMLLRQRYALRDDSLARLIIALQAELLDAAAFYRLYCNMETEAAWTAWKGVTGS